MRTLTFRTDSISADMMRTLTNAGFWRHSSHLGVSTFADRPPPSPLRTCPQCRRVLGTGHDPRCPYFLA